MLLVCEFCGEEFESCRKKRFCGKECQLSKRGKCKGCGSEYICKRQGRSVFCSTRCANKNNARGKLCNICLWCASVFTIKTRSSRNDGKYCSRECRFEYLNWRTGVREIQTTGDKWKIKNHKVKECLHCGKEFVTDYESNLLCSDHCRYERFKDRARENYEPKLKWMDCLYCGKMFCGSMRKTCSERCRRKNNRAKRGGRNHKERCERYGVKYDPAVTKRKILKRDDWTCQECGIKCRRDGEYLEDDAPELDHFIPLSRGGTHTWDNVRCLCRKCNGEKADAMPGTLFMA